MQIAINSNDVIFLNETESINIPEFIVIMFIKTDL